MDDFFAKKDKKKKGGKKFAKANTDVIAKNLIETDKKELREIEKQEKELGSQYSDDKTPTPQASQEDEEWEDFRENKKDYTGLKIENLTLQEPQPEEEEEETEINEDGEVVKVKKDDSGPWNKKTGNNETHQDLMPETKPVNVQVAPTNVVGGSYKPPHLRSTEPQVRPSPLRGKNKNAPDISSEVNFPSLSMAAEDGKIGGKGAGYRDDGGKFEEVKERGSGKSYAARHSEAPKISLDNRFSSLGNGD